MVFSIYLETCETSIQVVDDVTGAPVATATVCPPVGSTRAPAAGIWIKDWSENAGMFNALLDAGVIRDLGIFAACGHAVARGAVLTLEAIAERDRQFAESEGLLELRAKAYPEEAAHD